MTKHWTQMTEWEFAADREFIGGIEELICAHCWIVSKSWTDDLGIILCISCSHDYYCGDYCE